MSSSIFYICIPKRTELVIEYNKIRNDYHLYGYHFDFSCGSAEKAIQYKEWSMWKASHIERKRGNSRNH